MFGLGGWELLGLALTVLVVVALAGWLLRGYAHKKG